ncbi:MAG: serine/threonine transporter SstT, partial [Bacteroidales bacterium]|nr:serine/threonine transporter SstT [Bacteroidales bacterium]
MRQFIKRILNRWTSMSLILRILCGLAVGLFLGLAAPRLTGIGILGKMFVSALKGIAPVLVA